jgi:thiamine-phosphate pyrophosphorylase
MSAPPDVFYPIVPDLAWLGRLLPLGIKTVQLRMKDVPPETVPASLAVALDMVKKAGCQLIVNDYWKEAIDLGAEYLHLGQEDLADADLKAIKAAGMAIGISTHTEEELEIALKAAPDYVALGPIYETKLKAMRFGPQGLERITAWKKRIGGLPLIAIGGITPDRARGVIEAGADSIAVITDFFTAPHPEARVGLWLDWAATVRPATVRAN